MTDIKEVQDIKELPPFTIMFPDDIDLVHRRLKVLEGKLEIRGYKIHKPLNIYRRHIKGGSMLSVQLDKMDGTS